MLAGTILLTRSNKYVDAHGNLPKRPAFDKGLLKGLLYDRSVTEQGYTLLPPSLQNVCYINNPAKTPIAIRELAIVDLLIVSRSQEDFENGKVFRLDNFECLAKDQKIEIWVRHHRKV